MKLTFYKQAATPERIDKSDYMTEVGEIDGVVLKQPTNLLNAEFIFKTNPVLYNSNYFYCDFTGRYYFIRDYVALTGGRMSLTGEVDVLHTFRNEILNSEAWVEASDAASDTADYDMLHNDYPFQADYEIKGKDLDGGADWESPFDATYGASDTNIFFVIK